MKIKNIKKIIAAGLIAVTIALSLPAPAEAATSYKIGRAVITDHFVSHDEIDCYGVQGEGSHGCCLAFAAKAYFKIWGVNYGDYNLLHDNMLSNLSPDQKLNTAANMKKFLARAKPGALVRLDNNSDPISSSWYGHSLIFLEAGSRGAYFWEGNYDGHGSTGIRYHTYSELCDTGYYSKYTYIKYIIWPNASPYTLTDPNAFSVPRLLGTSNTDTGIMVSWRAVSGATGYNVYRKSLDSSYTYIGSVSGRTNTSFIDKKAVSGKKYYYTVRAKNSLVQGPCDTDGIPGFFLSATTTNTSARADYVRVTWNKSEGAQGYYIYRKISGGEYSLIGTISSGSTLVYRDYNASSGKKYYYKVKAFKGSYKSVCVYSSGIYYLHTPELSYVKSVDQGTKIRWTHVTNAKGYYVFRKTAAGAWVRIATLNDPDAISYVDTTGVVGTTYYYSVRAFRDSYKSYMNGQGIPCKYTLTLMKYRTTDAINFRKGPGTSYATAGSLSKGAIVNVIKGYSKLSGGLTWYKIYYNKHYYYVAAKFLKKI